MRVSLSSRRQTRAPPLAPHGRVMTDPNIARPLSELSHVHAGGCQSLNKSTKYDIPPVRHINAVNSVSKKKNKTEKKTLTWSSVSYGTRSVGYIFTQTGGHKTGPAESFVLRAKCSQRRRFIWPHCVCIARLPRPSFLSDALLAH